MAQTIKIPRFFQEHTGGLQFIEVNASTVGKAVEELEMKFPSIKQPLRDSDGNPRRFVNWYVNEEDIRFLQDFHTPLKNGDKLVIVPPVIDARTALSALRVAESLSNRHSENKP